MSTILSIRQRLDAGDSVAEAYPQLADECNSQAERAADVHRMMEVFRA